MTNRQDALDALITGVARRMTDVEPSADFQSRVLARLDTRRRWFRGWQLAAAGVVVAAAVTLFVVARSPSPTSTEAVRVPASTTAHAVEPVRETPVVARGVLTPGSVVAQPSARRASVLSVSAEAQAWHERAIPGLVASDPLTIVSIQPEALTIPLLEVAPIATEPLRGPAGTVNRDR